MFERVERGIVAGLCSYEVAAILTGKVPTITAMHRRRPVVGAVLVVALAWHFRPQPLLGTHHQPLKGAPPWHSA